MDTNLHEIDNYAELSNFAFHSNPEYVAEILNKRYDDKSHYIPYTEENIKRMPLSPINITTPFSIKTKKQASSNNIGDLIKLPSK